MARLISSIKLMMFAFLGKISLKQRFAIVIALFPLFIEMTHCFFFYKDKKFYSRTLFCL